MQIFTYDYEDKYLNPFAKKAKESLGRQTQEQPCPLRTVFQRDRDRIIHCKAFRRLKHKTQVFLAPEGDHYRTRLTHTLEVSQIARTISRALRLNEDLTEAIALGHDLGHTPYGHAGERVLNKITGFLHNEQSLRTVDYIENDFKGMNLTFEVRDGILNHTGDNAPATLEGKVVAISDRIAYLNHDIDDALRGGILVIEDIPKQFLQLFGYTHSKRISSMIMDIINNSYGLNTVKSSPEFCKGILDLRQFMSDNVYTSSRAKSQEYKAEGLVEYLYEYFHKNIDKIPQGFLSVNGTKEQHICDYISAMSDIYAARLFEDLTIPKGWDKL